MTLAKQNISFPFAQGLDTKSDPKQIMPGKLLTLQNGVFQRTGSLIKRNGYTALTQAIIGTDSSLTISSSVGCAAFKDELDIFTGTSLYGYSAGGWINKGPLYRPNTSVGTYPRPGAFAPHVLTTNKVRKDDNVYGQCNAAYSGGYLFYVYRLTSAGSLQLSIIDNTNGEKVSEPARINTGLILDHPKIFKHGSNVYLAALDSSGSGQLAIGTQSLTGLTTGTLVTNFTITFPNAILADLYDMAIVNNRLFVAHNKTNAAYGIYLFYYDSAGVKSANTIIAAEHAQGALTIFADSSNNIWVVYGDGTNLRYAIYNNDLTVQVLAPTTITTGSGSGLLNVTGVIAPNVSGLSNGAGACIFSEFTAAAPYNHYVSMDFANSAGTTAAFGGTTLRSVGLASKAFLYNSDPYVALVHSSTLQPTYFMGVAPNLSITAARSTRISLISKIAPSLAGGLCDNLPEVSNISTGVYHFPFLQKSLLTGTSGVISYSTGVAGAQLAFNTKSAHSVAIANNLHLQSGMLSMYDGLMVTEHGFHLYPEVLSAAKATTTGHIGDGTFEYIAIYEWLDNQGQIHRSATSIPISVSISSGTGTNKVTVTVDTYRLSDKSNTNVILYRTENGGTIFYRITSAAMDLSQDTVDVVDTLADASIIGNEQLYTTGGEVDNIAAPAVLSMTNYRNRLIVIPAEDRTSFWFSKEVIPGTPVEFSDLFVQNVDAKLGDLAAAATLDDKLILFKKTGIFFTAGDGPAPNGANNDYIPAQLITTDTGCSNAASIVTMPQGLMFQSPKGIYLLDRSLSASYIGAPVETYNSNTVTSAQLIQSLNQVRFTLDSGVALVYDYLFNQWSVFTNHSAVGATIFQNQFTYVQSNGLVLQETPGTYTDNGSFIQLSVLTSWLSFAGLQGFQRVYKALILGDYSSAHNLVVKLAYDFNSTYVQTDTINAGVLLPTVYQWRILLGRQKCEALQVLIQDSQSSAYGEGFKLSAIAFEVGIKQGLNKMSAASSFG